jgi:hypothetical protein
MASLHITSVKFSHYKAFSSYTIHLQEFNVLVGPNNSGKSTVVGAFRILNEGIRKAKAKSPERVEVDGLITQGYKLNIEDLPVASENIFHNYDESRSASVTFKLSNDSTLKLHFPERGVCIMVPEPKSGDVRTPKDFRTKFDLEVAFVPILGPVDQREPLFEKEAARRALMTNGASRNFRNIWYHYPDDFDKFRDMVQSSWLFRCRNEMGVSFTCSALRKGIPGRSAGLATDSRFGARCSPSSSRQRRQACL